MAPERFIRVVIPGIIAVYLCTCRPTDIILHGEITGKVTNAETGSAIMGAYVRLKLTYDSIKTDNNGYYLLKNLIPGTYEIQATQLGYASIPQEVQVISAKTAVSDLLLQGRPEAYVSNGYLDFGLDSTKLWFYISNSGHGGKFNYSLTPDPDWINLNHLDGVIHTEKDSISVTIDRTGLPADKIFLGTIRAIMSSEQETILDTLIRVYLNGVLDFDNNYYKVVKIGTQTWMAENLKVGKQINSNLNQVDNHKIEYYDYGDVGNNYKIYGGLYQWREMMNYMPPDNKPIGTTEGICPVGWHIPTPNEWQTLVNFLGGMASGGKMKEVGFEHWAPSPNGGATNVSGFSGLPGGLFGFYYDNPDTTFHRDFNKIRTNGIWWSSSLTPPSFGTGFLAWSLNFDNILIDWTDWSYTQFQGCSVRCVKDQP